MLAMLLPCVGAWAEVAPLKVSTDTQKYYYVIKNFRSNKFACYNGDATRLKQNGNPSSETAEADLNKYLWYITAATGEDAYMLHNIATQNICAGNESFTGSGATIYIKENPHNAGYFCISTNSDLTQNCWDDSNGNNVGTWAPAANDFGGTSWNFIEIEDQEATVAYTLTDNAGNSFNSTFTGWSREMYPVVTGVAGYTLSNIAYGDRNVTATVNFPFPVSKVDGTTNWTFIRTEAVSNYQTYLYVNQNEQIVSKSLDPANGNLGYLPTAQVGEIQKWQWAIYPTISDNNFTFKIKNATQGKYVPGTANTNGNTDAIFVTDENEAGIFSWGTCIGRNGFYLANNTGVFFAANSGKSGEQKAILWKKGGTHQGGNLQFTEPVYTANCTLTDNSKNSYQWTTTIAYTVEEGDVERPTITGFPVALLVNEKWVEGAYSANINLPFATSMGENINPIFISTFGSDLHKWFAVGTGIKTAKNVVATNSNIATHLWEIMPLFNNGAFTFHIKNHATGTFINSTSNENTHDEGVVTLSETASAFTFEDNGFKLSTGKFLSIGSSGGNTGTLQILGTWSAHNGTKLNFPTIKFTLEVGSTKFATLYTPVAGKFNGEIKTYAIESASGNSATLEEKTGVAANQGAIVEATPGTYTFTAGEVSSDWNGNLLTGTSVNTLVNESAYVLALVEGEAVLALADLNKDEAGATGTTHFLNNAGKAYLPASAVVAGARTLFFGGNTTGIEDSTLAPVLR